MSGGLDTAAGVIAIVGVADVVIRTGRELHRFLCDVSGAPTEVKKLIDHIQDSVRLVDALKHCTQTNVDVNIVASVETAVKALDRELQRMQLRLARFKAAKTTWTRIKYALDDRKLAKALENIERSKSLLVNSLTVLHGESSALNFHQISSLVTQVSTKADTLAQTMTSSLNMHHKSIKIKQNAHQEALQSQLNAHHKQHQKTVSKIQLDQADVSLRQERLLQISKQTIHRTAILERKIQRLNRLSIHDHQMTRSLLEEGFKELQTALHKHRVCTKRSGNEVYFRGERPDMIMAYLLPIQNELNTVLRRLGTLSLQNTPIQELSILGEELRKLIGSAAQEYAARYSMSTATAFDEWYFPGKYAAATANTEPVEEGSAKILAERFDLQSIGHESRQISKQANRKQHQRKTQTLFFETISGKLQLHIYRKEDQGCNNQKNCDLGLTFTTNAASFTIVDIRFIRSFLHHMRPRICTHLSVFTMVPSTPLDAYHNLFYNDSTLEDIDHAIRRGSISPYHVDYRGRNLILYAAAQYGRVDVLQYLESNGIGITGLRQDCSIRDGLYLGYNCYRRSKHQERNALSTFRYVRQLVCDPISLLVDLICNFVVDFYGQSISRSDLATMDTYLAELHKEGYDCAKYRFQNSAELSEFVWDRQTLCNIMLLLVKDGADISREYRDVGSFRHLTTNRVIFDEKRMPEAFEDLLYAYIQASADIHVLDPYDRTPSMAARLFGFWSLWCQALRESGKDIKEVVRAEGNEWLLGDDWEHILLERERGRSHVSDS